MGKFYLDMEFTNGNYYFADIIEIALAAEDSGNTFYGYTRIHYTIPKYIYIIYIIIIYIYIYIITIIIILKRVKELTNITDKTLATIGCSFKDTVISLNEFIHNEQLQSKTDPIIIAHGGYLHDFPILLANCMKYNFNDYGILKDCLFIDSVHIFTDDGYRRAGLDTLYKELYIKRNIHSGLGDARILKAVFDKKPELLDHPYGYTFKDIVTRAMACCSYAELDLICIKFVKKKTALNINQVFKIAYWYFKNRYIFCK